MELYDVVIYTPGKHRSKMQLSTNMLVEGQEYETLAISTSQSGELIYLKLQVGFGAWVHRYEVTTIEEKRIETINTIIHE